MRLPIVDEVLKLSGSILRTGIGTAERLVRHVLPGGGQPEDRGAAAPARPSAPPPRDTQQHTPPAAAPMPPRPGTGAPVAAPASVPSSPPPPPAPQGPNDVEPPDLDPASTPLETEPDEVVLSSADRGAEDGVGANLRVDEPWKGYDQMKVADITDRLAVADAATLAAVQLYETTHRDRKGVVAEVDRRMKAQAGSTV